MTVCSALVLVGGAPGIGKSTLLLQLCGRISERETILYVSGEESQRQLKMRAQRLGVDHGSIYVLAETDLNTVLSTIDDLQPTVLIVDSIQTMYDAETASTPGSISQVRECTMRIMRSAKDSGYTAFVVGHINKEGSIAGPKVLEHMVDCVLYFEGDQSMSYRILRAAKNRFGSTNEIGVFEMEDSGLREVTNPSEMLLSGRPINAPGTCVVGVMEGSRTVLAEVQALVTPSGYSGARRNANGIDYNRAMLLLAVLEKRAGFSLSGCDAYINVVGGLRLDEPAADLPVALSLVSSLKALGLAAEVTGDAGRLRAADRIILPGVGAFGDARAKLDATGLVPVIQEEAEKKPLLGICLGMQLLFDKSFEYGEHPGLGLVPGQVVDLRRDLTDKTLKVPHMGWNSLQILKDDPLFRHVRDGEYVYYVHSFYARDCAAGTLAASRYGNVDVTGVVRRGNVYGTQFHPEKSGDTGLRLLRAFAEL